MPAGRQGSVRPFELGQLVGRGIIAGVLIGCHDGLDTATELAASIKVVSGQVRLALLLSEDRDVASVPGPARALFSAIFSSHEHLESLQWLASTIPTDPTDPAEEHNS